MFKARQEAAIASRTKTPAKKTAGKPAKPAAVKTVKPAKPKKPAAEPSLHDLVMTSLDQDKGEDIVSIDLSGKSSIADFMVIATGTSSRHVASMADKLIDRLAKTGRKARAEGKDSGDWVIVDAGDVIIHLFRAEVRNFYNLEKLWMADFSTSDYTVYKSV